MKIKFAVISKTGRRSKNEDYVKVIDKPEEVKWLGIVCDGMGGHAMGETASETVCNAVVDYWLRSSDEDSVIKARRACRSASANWTNWHLRCIMPKWERRLSWQVLMVTQ